MILEFRRIYTVCEKPMVSAFVLVLLNLRVFRLLWESSTLGLGIATVIGMAVLLSLITTIKPPAPNPTSAFLYHCE